MRAWCCAALQARHRWSRWLHRVFLASALCVVVLGVIGMHQLSLGHDFAASPAAGGHGLGAAHLEVGGPRLTGAGRDVRTPAAAWGASSSVGADACPGCGQHSMAFSACLLALTLLVLTWRLKPPQVRHLPPRWLRGPATVVVLIGRPLAALSLTELSILRT